MVFTRAAAVVHHGGIGTSAQALAAGAPQLVMPMAHDQPDNAARLERLGVAATLAPKKFIGADVAQKLGLLISSEEVCARCKKYAEMVDSEKSVNEACEEIEKTGK
jgi:UDP:flavonoid glycosyltransferase YjiC (YdhE family)